MKPSDFAYEMTVVIPVYNATSCVGRCIASLDVQSISQDRFEVILVNDGSTDKSLALCQDMAIQRNNYVLINQENQGVSAARNAGIRAARGRYIMFVDADDAVSKWAIERLVRTFKRYEHKVDLLTYAVAYVNLKENSVHGHKRAQWLTKTGVYDLAHYPHVAQSTPNVCIRNDGDATPLFPEGMRMGEDQYFNTMVLASKGMLGFCVGATYYHIQQENSSSSLWDEPRFCFDDMMRLYTQLVGIAQGNQRMADYAYGLVLYNMSWRLRQNMLSLDFGNEATQRANHERLAKVLRAIPLANWMQSPYLTDVQRVHLMQRFGVVGNVCEAVYSKTSTRVFFENDALLELGLPNARIYWAVREPNRLSIKGFLLAPTFDSSSRPQLRVSWDGGQTEALVSYVQRSTEVPDASERCAWHFAFELPPMDGHPYAATLSATVGEQSIPALDLSFDVRRCNGRRINARMREFGDRRITLAGSTLRVGTIKDLPEYTMPVVTRMMRVRDKSRVGDYNVEEVQGLRASVPKLRRALANERLWLYVGANDALAQDLDLHDGVVRMSMDDLKDPATRAAAVLLAQRIVSSVYDFKRFLPIDYRTWDRVADLTVQQTYVFVGDDRLPLEGTSYDER